MPKILGQTGMSLADSYDVQGSSAGVDFLDSNDVQLVHEMGGVMLAERLAGVISVVATGAIAQSTSFSAEIAQVADVPMLRLLNLVVEVDTAGRVADANIVITNNIPTIPDESPIWVFDGTNTDTMRYFIAGTQLNRNVLRPIPAYTRLPNFLVGSTQRQQTPELNVRGNTSAFGAGTVVITVEALFAFPAAEGLSSAGIPVPAW